MVCWKKTLKFVQFDSRLVTQDGATNIITKGIIGRQRQYMYDFFTTMVDMKWRWNLLIFVATFVLCWIIFAAYYYFLCKLNGDFENVDNKDWIPCVGNAKSFVSVFLFSIETQTTIGYGFRYVTEECPAIYFGVLLQSIIGAALQAALAGLVLAKLKSAKKRSGTILFSRVACIMETDWELRLVIRISDIRKSHIIRAHARGVLVKKVFSKTGTHIPVQHYSVEFKAEDGGTNIFLAWPSNIVHVIDENSPFWDMSKEDLRHENFELVVIFGGIVSATSRAIELKTSYLPHDIIWGHRFVTLDQKIDRLDRHMVDFEHFDQTHPAPTPYCSARELNKMLREGTLSLDKLLKSSDGPKKNAIPHKRYSVTDTFLGADICDDLFDDYSDD
ncbi:hypothetical protein CHS0354_039171 [Potamilus streckersoni]|uniref:Uncharacterized protein n=1 Tax=Potamilus streckersoni TaxID=2493646 RepID=A0AAE0S7R5_9BIVA|nr:hypothetical protein CHS0354_039171 [Potamilus streckersoni]